ncbi:MAG: ribosomal protein [Acidobacteria bacterium]|nr:ribosomal protein [Acidobacteriota bacterium]
MATVTMKELLEAGVHFGHQVRRWNPKMKEYIFGERNGIYIIDLQKTQKLFRDALNYVTEALTEKPNMKVLFVGTKRQAQDAIKEEAERAGQFYVNNRWLGGLLTNYQTVQKSIQKLRDIETMKEDGRFEMLTKKERLQMDREQEGLMKNLAGIKDMHGLPDMIFIIDVRKEDIAVKEANRLGIPIVAVVDTNCSPEGISQVIPGNDDALRAIRLFASRIADAILEGQQVATEGRAGAVQFADNAAAADSTAALEPSVVVADQSFHSAEETHSDPKPAAGAAPAGGASGKIEPEVRSQVEKSAAVSEDMVAAREAVSGQEIKQSQDGSKEESNEATAS